MTRTEAINEVATHIAGLIKPDLDAASIAAMLIDDKDAAAGEDISVEVPGRYTVSGNPLVSSTVMPEDAAEEA